MNLENYFDAHFYGHLFRKYKIVFYQNYLEYTILIFITFSGCSMDKRLELYIMIK